MVPPAKDLSLADAGELGVLALIRDKLAGIEAGVIRGIGEDCAVISNGNYYLLVTTDTLVEDVHFSLSYTTPYLLGKKALAVNLSDIASMGGTPTHALLNFAAPPGLPLSFVREIVRGIHFTSNRYKVPVIGGDTVACPPGIVLTMTVLGRCQKDQVAFRSGAREGDLVFTSGYLGDSAGGLTLLREQIEPKPHHKTLLKAHLDPVPQIELGRWLTQHKLVTSMIDLSDGLSTDLAHVAEESGLSAEIFLDKIPISSCCRKAAEELGRSPVSWALTGGEDYGLLFTVPIERAEEVKRSRSRGPFCIGKMTKGRGVYLIENGKREDISYRGYSHFLP